MTKIIIASTNPVKIEAVEDAFDKVFSKDKFEIEGVDVESNVSDQPMSDSETHQGALNRANNAREQHPEADFWVGIEGGVEATETTMDAFAWVVVLSENNAGQSRTATFTLPDEIVELVRDGVELGEADDRVFNRQNSKKKNGAVGILTEDLIDRTSYYEHAVILALIPFLNTKLSFTL